MNRRDFLVNTCGACLAITGVSAALSSCNPTRYLTGDLGKDGLSINKKDFRKKQKAKKPITHLSSFVMKPCCFRFMYIASEKICIPLYGCNALIRVLNYWHRAITCNVPRMAVNSTIAVR